MADTHCRYRALEFLTATFAIATVLKRRQIAVDTGF